MFQTISSIWKAIKAGEDLSRAETWKQTQVASGYILTILGTLLGLAKMAGIDVQISEADQAKIAAGLVSLYGLFNVIATVVSTNKINYAGKKLTGTGDGSLPAPTPQSTSVPNVVVGGVVQPAPVEVPAAQTPNPTPVTAPTQNQDPFKDQGG
jgi:hypothetical protein